MRILGKTRHLQSNTVIHWGTWLGCTVALGAISFILAETIPVFTLVIALVGSVCFAPLAISLPGWLWLFDHGDYLKGSLTKKAVYVLHWGMVALGIFFLIGATYGVAIDIKMAYASGGIGTCTVFSEEQKIAIDFSSRYCIQLRRQLEFVVGQLRSFLADLSLVRASV